MCVYMCIYIYIYTYIHIYINILYIYMLFYNCFVKTDLGAFGNPRTMKFHDFQAFDFAMFYCVVFKIPMCWNDHKEESY